MGNQKEKPDRSCTGVVYQKVTPNVPESRSSRETSGGSCGRLLCPADVNTLVRSAGGNRRPETRRSC